MKQEKTGWVFVMLLIFASAGTSALTPPGDRKAEKVLNDFVLATGGKSALSDVETIVSHSELKFIESGMSIDREIIETGEKEYYIKVFSPRIGEITRGHDGKTCWEKGGAAAKIIDGEEKISFLNGFSLLRFDRWENHLEEYRYESEVVADGKALHKIAVTTRYGQHETWYFDKESHLLAKTEEPLSLPEGMSTVVTIYSDYREVGGIMLPFAHLVKMPGQTRKITFSSININNEVEKSLFHMPD